MVSYTSEVVPALLSKLPEQYLDLTACFATVVHDLATGHSEGYQDRVHQLAESYFVLLMETLQPPLRGNVATPGVVRFLAHQASAQDGSLALLPHRAQIVDAVFEQFEDRLWDILRTAFSGAVTLPERGLCDLVVPAFGILMSNDLLRSVRYDDIPTLMVTTRHALAQVDPADVFDVLLQFVDQMLSMIEGKTRSSVHRIHIGLEYFVADLELSVPQEFAERFEKLRVRIANTPGHAPAVRRPNVLN